MDYQYLDDDEDFPDYKCKPGTKLSRAKQLFQCSCRGVERAIRRVKRTYDRASRFVDNHITATFNGPADMQIERWLAEKLGTYYP